jgi:hypothetical protein
VHRLYRLADAAAERPGSPEESSGGSLRVRRASKPLSPSSTKLRRDQLLHQAQQFILASAGKFSEQREVNQYRPGREG